MSSAPCNALPELVRTCRAGAELAVIESGALGKQLQFSLPPLPAGEGHESQRDQPDHESDPQAARPRVLVSGSPWMTRTTKYDATKHARASAICHRCTMATRNPRRLVAAPTCSCPPGRHDA